MRPALVLVATLSFSVLVAGQSPAPGDSRPRFDTVSVKPNRSPESGLTNPFSPGRPLEGLVIDKLERPTPD